MGMDPIDRMRLVDGGEIIEADASATLTGSDRPFTIWPSGEVAEWTPDPDAPVVTLNAENGWSVTLPIRGGE
jgi:hypothetical protein